MSVITTPFSNESSNLKIPAFAPQGGASRRQANIKGISKFKIYKTKFELWYLTLI
jgi:hypothetical protein